jgi:hypothetical protein
MQHKYPQPAQLPPNNNQKPTPSKKIHSHLTEPNRIPHPNRTKTTRWTPEETRRFYMALRQCGTDFTTMELMFPTRDRAQLKVRVCLIVFVCVPVCACAGVF